MSRKLVYLNGQNESLTFETAPYLIVKIEGLGIPNVDRKEQKAPYQDGTTYIDSLLQNRDIVVELAITKPNDFTDIALYRRELSQRLTPKYGLGDLNYTDEDGNEYTIRAVVSSMVFPNKDYRDPYMRAMVTFTACDPYWRSVTDTTISLPTPVTGSEEIANAAYSNTPRMIRLSNGNLYAVYIRAGDGFAVSRTFTTSWGAETEISDQRAWTPNIIQLANGDLLITYCRNSDNYLVSRTFTTAWSAETVINATATSGIASMLELADGNVIIAYRDASLGYLVSRTFTTSWGAEVTINSVSTYESSMIQRTNGNLVIIYRRSADSYLGVRIYENNAWSSEVIANGEASNGPSLIERSDGTLFVAYQQYPSLGYTHSMVYTTEWSSPSVINESNTQYLSVIELPSGSLIIAYQRSGDSYLVYKTRSITPVLANNTGDVPAPILVTFQGPSTNPRIINQDTLEYIRLNTTLAASDSFEVDTSFGNKTVILTQGGIVKNGIAYLDIGSTFFQLERGSNTVYYEDDAVLSTATASLEFTERYSGL